MMKTRLIPLLLFLLAGLLGGLQSTPAETAKTLYTCGMHPQVIQDHPGNCPICGMRLTPIKGGGDPAAATSPDTLAVDAATRQNMNLRTAVVQTGNLTKTIRTLGTIDYNETALTEVTTKFRGWIEKLNVDATGQLVHRGEPLFEIYAPELYSAQVEYLQALNFATTNDPANAVLLSTAENKLRFLDVPAETIAALAQTRQARKTLPVYAPMAGFVIEKNVVQGQMVEAGMRLYRLADLGIVWVIAQIYEQDLPLVKLGQEALVKVAAFPDREFRGRVTYVYPSVDEKTRTARVRLEFENPGYFLKPGMFVSAQIKAQAAANAVLVPDSAVLRSGARNTVFVAVDDGKFTAREVILGSQGENGLNQVLSGLAAGERVVTSGQFLLDSESQLQEAIEKMKGPSPAAGMEQHPPAATNALGESPLVSAAPATSAALAYVCPMPEHVSIIYDHAGDCPVCGMALVPVDAAALQKTVPGGQVLYYTCPMPEHASVHLDKPGKCPLCAMTLIPVMSAPAAPAASGTNAPAPATVQKYTCTMHPEVISDHPGICPKCEMELVPVKPQ